MSVLFYRRPDYLDKANGPINSTQCQRYVERAKNSERAIPAGLSFEDVMNNKSLPPCSLNDFMDYLVYVEYNAENLQFYLWYQDYAQRFEALSEKEKSLSKPWNPDLNEMPNLMHPERANTKKSRRATAGVRKERAYDANGVIVFSEDHETPIGSNDRMSMIKDSGSTFALSMSDVTAVPTSAEVVAQAGLKWQPFSIQPMRDEVNRMMRHYLAFTAPRELNLSHKDRATCLHALQHTTHPSALAPAIKIAEATLRGQSHPNFIRWSICNGNKPRVFFVRTMGVSNIVFGFLIAILLTLSSVSRWWRIFAALEWFVGISTMVAAYKGLCVIMHHSHTRNLRPWEQELDSEMGDDKRASFSSTANRNLQMGSRAAHYDTDTDKEQMDKEDDVAGFKHLSLHAFGPKNTFDDASWVEKYQKKPLLRKVFDRTTWTQDETLRILQDKIVLGANIWGLILTVPLTIIFVALPKGNFY